MSKLDDIGLKFEQQKLDDKVEYIRSLSDGDLIDRYSNLCTMYGEALYRMELKTANELSRESGIYGEELHRRLSEAKHL